MLIPISEILIDYDFNCRGKDLKEADVKELMKSIVEVGLLQPPSVRKLVDSIGCAKWKLVAGFRRLTAVRLLGWTEVECTVVESISDESDRIINLTENIHRANLTLAQEVEAIRVFYERGWTETKLAAKINQTRGWVQVRYMLLKMPKEVLDENMAGNITQTDVRDLYTLWKMNNDETQLFDAIRSLKGEKKVKGRGVRIKTTEDTKRCRSSSEMNRLTEYLVDTVGPSLASVVSAWCAGAVADSVLRKAVLEINADAIDLADYEQI